MHRSGPLPLTSEGPKQGFGGGKKTAKMGVGGKECRRSVGNYGIQHLERKSQELCNKLSTLCSCAFKTVHNAVGMTA